MEIFKSKAKDEISIEDMVSNAKCVFVIEILYFFYKHDYVVLET